MNKNEHAYLDLCKQVMENGSDRDDRTKTGTRSIFGYQMRFDLNENFPLLTTKKVPLRLIVSELLWFIKGDTNIRYLLEHNNNIWNEWAFKSWVESEEYDGPDMTDFGIRSQKDPEFKKQYEKQLAIFKENILTDDEFANRFGELGNVYGKQWRDWRGPADETVDQLKQVIEQIKQNPSSRRLIVSAWNPVDVPSMALPPCHTLFQFYVENGKLSCQLYQRSGDVFLGIPFNIASYALLTHLVAHECQLEVGEFIHTIGDAHIYHNHFEQINTLLSRTPKTGPTLTLNKDKQHIFDFNVEDIQIENYHPHPPIKAPVAV
ncbi:MULTISPECIES: thymidylate synthase [Allobacillus]|uniref:Thymidylate synthase n=2 Tax=Allobacillus halotolerans TaxID=570278 RepID=A0ABS6GJQ0_9BACI|nr:MULTISPECIES: thymidylate synthase [Allobacillus]MBU6079468.1 thymidylate synthase [Allobacillus halotolerans]TSJ69075.1 thymidylate synthase [Allobacillus sp. SKP2-8]